MAILMTAAMLVRSLFPEPCRGCGLRHVLSRCPACGVKR